MNVLWEDDVPVECSVSDFQEDSILNRIYVGRVRNIVQNIGAVFVEYQKDKTAYLEQRSVPEARIGDSFLVQITREAAGSKPPRCSAELSLGGQYAVLTSGLGKVAVSAKIRGEGPRKRLKQMLNPFITDQYGWILRTAAAEAPEEKILQEIRRLTQQFVEIQKARYYQAFTEVYRPLPYWLTEIRDRDFLLGGELVTDQQDLYTEIQKLGAEEENHNFGLRLYGSEEPVPLYRLYGMQGLLEQATSKYVWLKSGAYLVIQQTEAMVVIDVNSGKAIRGKKNPAETLQKIDLEAAVEVMRQLRLRNLSGIIAVDFIDLPEAQMEEQLLGRLRELARTDTVRTDVVEMTKLKFAVLTREKVRMPLSDQLRKIRNQEPSADF